MYYIMKFKKILIIIGCLLIILYASFGTIQREKEVKNILDAPFEQYSQDENNMEENNMEENNIEENNIEENNMREYNNEEDHIDKQKQNIEGFQLYTPKCSNLSLKKCYNSLQCGLSLENNNLLCQEGGLSGPYNYPTKTWIYNGKCWGEDCNNVIHHLNNLPHNPFNPNNPISPYNPGYKLDF